MTVIRMVRIPLRMVRVGVRKARIGIRLFKTVHHRMTRTVTMKRQNIHYHNFFRTARMAIVMIIMIGTIRIGWSLEWVVVREVRMGVWTSLGSKYGLDCP